MFCKLPLFRLEYSFLLTALHLLEFCSGLISSPTECHACNGTKTLSECKLTKQTCKQYEECYLQEYEDEGGTVLYYGGCATASACVTSTHPEFNYHRPGLPSHSGTQRCFRCCRSNLCNAYSCINDIHRHHECYSCDAMSSPSGCKTKRTCREHEYCYMQVYENTIGNIEYHTGCANLLQCGAANHPERPHSPGSRLPTRDGTEQCGSCCYRDLCNNQSCHVFHLATNAPLTSGTTAVTVPKGRVCYKCYDIRMDSRGIPEPCSHTEVCSSPTSQCSTVFRQDNDIVTMDTDCEENLKCDIVTDTHQLCGICCDGDKCNSNIDCRVRMTPPVINVTEITTPSTEVSASSTTGTTTAGTTTAMFYEGVDCMICDGPLCGVNASNETQARCPDNFAPFCLNRVINDADGKKHVTKR